MLAKIGVNWKVDAVDAVSGADRLKNLEFDVSMWAAAYIQDPDSLSWYHHPKGAWNNGRIKNNKVVPLIEAARIEIDQSKRQKIYHRIEELMYENYDDIWLWGEVSALTLSKKVQGWNNKMYIENRTWYTSSHPMWFKDGRP
ncbi:MAG: hypothetical protein JRF41_13005 [Deltaproteobacteria bacterium]|nr:hypothetical protein [Deltaproteobacteria bacterium]